MFLYLLLGFVREAAGLSALESPPQGMKYYSARWEAKGWRAGGQRAGAP